MIEYKRHIILCLFGILFLVASFAQNTDEQIKSIRSKFRAINKDTALRKATLSNEEFLEQTPDQGAELTGYYKGAEIKKIYEWIGLSNGINIREFYFDNNKLFFVYEKFEMFIFDREKNEFDMNKTKTIFEGRYYFNNSKIFDSVIKGKKSVAGRDESSEKSLLESADNNLKILNKKFH